MYGYSSHDHVFDASADQEVESHVSEEDEEEQVQVVEDYDYMEYSKYDSRALRKDKARRSSFIVHDSASEQEEEETSFENPITLDDDEGRDEELEDLSFSAYDADGDVQIYDPLASSESTLSGKRAAVIEIDGDGTGSKKSKELAYVLVDEEEDHVDLASDAEHDHTRDEEDRKDQEDQSGSQSPEFIDAQEGDDMDVSAQSDMYDQSGVVGAGMSANSSFQSCLSGDVIDLSLEKASLTHDRASREENVNQKEEEEEIGQQSHFIDLSMEEDDATETQLVVTPTPTSTPPVSSKHQTKQSAPFRVTRPLSTLTEAEKIQYETLKSVAAYV